jgi:hypothetical protein
LSEKGTWYTCPAGKGGGGVGGGGAALPDRARSGRYSWLVVSAETWGVVVRLRLAVGVEARDGRAEAHASVQAARKSRERCVITLHRRRRIEAGIGSRILNENPL